MTVCYRCVERERHVRERNSEGTHLLCISCVLFSRFFRKWLSLAYFQTNMIFVYLHELTIILSYSILKSNWHIKNEKHKWFVNIFIFVERINMHLLCAFFKNVQRMIELIIFSNIYDIMYLHELTIILSYSVLKSNEHIENEKNKWFVNIFMFDEGVNMRLLCAVFKIFQRMIELIIFSNKYDICVPTWAHDHFELFCFEIEWTHRKWKI
jgi:hypothetical protein